MTSKMENFKNLVKLSATVKDAAADGKITVFEIKSEMLRDSHKLEEDFARLENKVDNQGTRIGEIAAAIKEQAANRDAMLVQIYEAITRGGRKSDV